MITNAIFGERLGRMGNQLFQIAMLLGVRERCGYDYFLARNGESVWDCFELDIPSHGPGCASRFDEMHGSCNFDPSVFGQPDGTAFHGYFQSFRYFEGHEQAVTRLLQFKQDLRSRSEALAFFYRRRYGRPLVSLHIRRADYVLPQSETRWGNLAKDGYYERVVKEIGQDMTYLIFSDDLEWCQGSFDLECPVFVDLDHCLSLSLMACCDVNVVANSTFSWWGAFLNSESDVYAPRRWFGPDMPPPNDRQDDIIPPTWRTIPTFVT